MPALKIKKPACLFAGLLGIDDDLRAHVAIGFGLSRKILMPVRIGFEQGRALTALFSWLPRLRCMALYRAAKSLVPGSSCNDGSPSRKMSPESFSVFCRMVVPLRAAPMMNSAFELNRLQWRSRSVPSVSCVGKRDKSGTGGRYVLRCRIDRSGAKNASMMDEKISTRLNRRISAAPLALSSQFRMAWACFDRFLLRRSAGVAIYPSHLRRCGPVPLRRYLHVRAKPPCLVAPRDRASFGMLVQTCNIHPARPDDDSAFQGNLENIGY